MDSLCFSFPTLTRTGLLTLAQPASPKPAASPLPEAESTISAAKVPAASHETRQLRRAETPAQSVSFPTPGTPVSSGNSSAPASNSPDIDAARAHLTRRFQTLARDNLAGLQTLLTQVYGDKVTPQQLEQLRQQARDGALPMPEMRFVPAEQLQGHHGAYATSEGVIYLSENLRHAPGLLNAVVEAEIGHPLDQVIGGNDSPGDEGQILAMGLLQGGNPIGPEDLQVARALSDHKTMDIDGKSVDVETIAPAVVAGLWWAGQVTAKTGVDAAIIISELMRDDSTRSSSFASSRADLPRGRYERLPTGLCPGFRASRSAPACARRSRILARTGFSPDRNQLALSQIYDCCAELYRGQLSGRLSDSAGHLQALSRLSFDYEIANPDPDALKSSYWGFGEQPYTQTQMRFLEAWEKTAQSLGRERLSESQGAQALSQFLARSTAFPDESLWRHLAFDLLALCPDSFALAECPGLNPQLRSRAAERLRSHPGIPVWMRPD